jgi:predicted membrane channel-forming protein YqfA (hemolysin III family)
MDEQPKIARSIRSNFYYESYHTVLRWLFIEIVIILTLIGIIMYLVFSQKAPPYYATMLSGKVIPLYPQK